MPKSILILIIFGLTIGTWTTVRPRFDQSKKVKGKAISRAELQSLPNLAPLPQKKADSSPPIIDAHNVAIIDVDSGYFLYEKEADKPVSIASLTKIMTAVLTLENLKMDTIVEIPKEATQTIGSLVDFRPGEKITTENLLYGLLVSSGNDAALTLANQLGGVEDFVKLMNQKAEQLGMRDTSFKDPAGLNDEGLSSTHDMAILMAYALRNQTFRKIINTAKIDIASSDGVIVHNLENSNRLVKEDMYYPGIIGGKTGFTPMAGHNLIAAAQRDGHTVIAVIINTFSPAKDASAIEAKKALDWTFTNHVW